MKRRYRIAMVAPGPFPSPRGSQILVRDLAQALGALGHSVHIVAYGAGDDMPSTPGVQVHRIPAFLGGAGMFGPHPWRLVLNLFLLATLYRVVRRHGVHVIHAHNYEAPALGYVIRFLLGIPVVYHAHNLMGDELGYYFRRPWARRMAGALGRVLDRLVPRQADWVVALSDAMADDLRAQGVAAERLEVIPPGMFSWQEAEGGATDPYPGAKVIAYAGNLDAYQNLPALIEAMPKVRRAEPRALLVIVTQSPTGDLDRQIRGVDLGESIRVVEADGYDAVRAVLRRADLLVCPRRSSSGFPIKLLNYMAAGRPIVVAAGAARALGEGPWLVVSDSYPAALADVIVATLADPALGHRLGGAAQRRLRKVYDWNRLAPRVERVYGRVVPPAPNTVVPPAPRAA